LKLPPEDWPSGELQPDEDLVMQERRKGIVSSLLCKSDKADWYYIFSNDYDRVVRVLAWVLGFVNGCRKQRIGQCMGKIPRQRFKKEYLGQLVLTTKQKGRKLQPREVVLLGLENSKRIDWPLGVVEEFIPGRYGEVWLVKLRKASGFLLRPIQRVYPLEMHEEELLRPDQISAEIAQETQETVASLEKDRGSKGVRIQTRSGGEIKLPSQFRGNAVL
jgi:hypothetical protein